MTPIKCYQSKNDKCDKPVKRHGDFCSEECRSAYWGKVHEKVDGPKYKTIPEIQARIKEIIENKPQQRLKFKEGK